MSAASLFFSSMLSSPSMVLMTTNSHYLWLTSKLMRTRWSWPAGLQLQFLLECLKGLQTQPFSDLLEGHLVQKLRSDPPLHVPWASQYDPGSLPEKRFQVFLRKTWNLFSLLASFNDYSRQFYTASTPVPLSPKGIILVSSGTKYKDLEQSRLITM